MGTKTPGQQPPPVPAEFGNKWVAWSPDHMQILASAETFRELWQEVQRKKIEGAIIERVPPANARFVGRAGLINTGLRATRVLT